MSNGLVNLLQLRRVAEAVKQQLRGVESGAGGEGQPVGTVISYMGTTAPTGYLICDGAVKNVSDYPALAQHFKTQEATDHLYSAGTTTSHNFPASDNAGRWEPKNYDSRKAAPYRGVFFTDAWDGTYNNVYLSYTSRPVNMAVLYCIKF